MPSGTDSAIWRRWQNEIEMLLHDHAVNRAREGRGMLPVNAVWFSGGGRLRDVPSLPTTFANAPASRIGDLARGIARASGTRAADRDVGSAVSHASEIDGNAVVIDVMPGVTDADELEMRVFAPALALLAARSLATVQLIADGNATVMRWSAHRPGAWRRIAMRMSRPTFEIPPASGA